LVKEKISEWDGMKRRTLPDQENGEWEGGYHSEHSFSMGKGKRGRREGPGRELHWREPWPEGRIKGLKR